MSHPENLLSPSSKTSTYVIIQSCLYKTVIEARAELITVDTSCLFLSQSRMRIVEHTDGRDLRL